MNNHKSQELNELFKAMALAQAEMKVAGKDSSNPFFKSSYANLQSIIEASRPSLCKNGLSVMQQVISEESGDYLVTMLCHSSGQWISSQMRIAPVKTDVQSLGSYITYLRRYSYAALVGVYDGHEDDDGNAAVHQEVKTGWLSKESLGIINTLTHKYPELRDTIKTQYKIDHFNHLKQYEADLIISKFKE